MSQNKKKKTNASCFFATARGQMNKPEFPRVRSSVFRKKKKEKKNKKVISRSNEEICTEILLQAIMLPSQPLHFVSFQLATSEHYQLSGD